MTALVLALGTDSCWEPFWSTGFIGREDEVTNFTQLWHSREEACSEMTEGEERASVNIHSREKSLCAFLTHHPHSVSVIGAFRL